MPLNTVLLLQGWFLRYQEDVQKLTTLWPRPRPDSLVTKISPMLKPLSFITVSISFHVMSVIIILSIVLYVWTSGFINPKVWMGKLAVSSHLFVSHFTTKDPLSHIFILQQQRWIRPSDWVITRQTFSGVYCCCYGCLLGQFAPLLLPIKITELGNVL